METPITYITKVEIEKLWGLDDWNLTWELNPDVNILAGDNGSGKSTVLRFVFNALTQKIDSKMSLCLDKGSIKINFEDAFAQVIKANEEQKRLFSETSVSKLFPNKPTEFITLKDLVDRSHELLGFHFNILIDDFRLGTFLFYIPKGYKEHTFFLTTFDQKLKEQETIQKLAGTGVETDLDWELYQLQDKYKDYQIRIWKRKALQGGSNDTNEINSKLNLFWDIVDELFGNTEKRIERDKTNLSFLFRQDKVLTAYDLSAGEKQMLVILLTALVQDNQPAIMIMDEPEVSLHTDWQESLIDNVRKLNENVQLIIATHSPFLLTNGWIDKKYIFQIEKLRQYTLA